MPAVSEGNDLSDYIYGLLRGQNWGPGASQFGGDPLAYVGDYWANYGGGLSEFEKYAAGNRWKEQYPGLAGLSAGDQKSLHDAIVTRIGHAAPHVYAPQDYENYVAPTGAAPTGTGNPVDGLSHGAVPDAYEQQVAQTAAIKKQLADVAQTAAARRAQLQMIPAYSAQPVSRTAVHANTGFGGGFY